MIKLESKLLYHACADQSYREDLSYNITLLDDQLEIYMHVLDMFLWIFQTIIIIKSHLCRDVLLRDEGVQYSSR